MGEGTGRLNGSHASENGRERENAEPREAAQALGGEIATVRSELDVLVAELDRRRHNALNLELQVRQHALGLALTAVAFVGAATGVVWFGLWRTRQRRRPTAQGSRLREAVSRMVAHPERVATDPSMMSKIMTAAVNAALASVIKKTLERVVNQMLERPHPTTGRPRRALPRTSAPADHVGPETSGATPTPSPSQVSMR